MRPFPSWEKTLNLALKLGNDGINVGFSLAHCRNLADRVKDSRMVPAPRKPSNLRVRITRKIVGEIHQDLPPVGYRLMATLGD
jgi:hypothetical protein